VLTSRIADQLVDPAQVGSGKPRQLTVVSNTDQDAAALAVGERRHLRCERVHIVHVRLVLEATVLATRDKFSEVGDIHETYPFLDRLAMNTGMVPIIMASMSALACFDFFSASALSSKFAGQNKKVFLADPLFRRQWQPFASCQTENLVALNLDFIRLDITSIGHGSLL
jgi:hypothetical protein